jgi:hypothetical protein
MGKLDLIILIFIFIFNGKMSYYGFNPSEELRSHPTGIIFNILKKIGRIFNIFKKKKQIQQ